MNADNHDWELLKDVFAIWGEELPQRRSRQEEINFWSDLQQCNLLNAHVEKPAVDPAVAKAETMSLEDTSGMFFCEKTAKLVFAHWGRASPGLHGGLSNILDMRWERLTTCFCDQ